MVGRTFALLSLRLSCFCFVFLFVEGGSLTDCDGVDITSGVFRAEEGVGGGEG